MHQPLRTRLIVCIQTLFLFCVLPACQVKPPASQFPTADHALEQMRNSYACVNGIQGESRIDVYDKNAHVRGSLYYLTLNPDLVRFDAISPFGSTVYTVTTNGQSFEMLDLMNNQFLTGNSPSCAMSTITKVPIPIHALVSLLRGEAPVLKHTSESAQLFWNTQGFYRVAIDSLHNANEEIHLEVHPDDFDKPWNHQRLRVKYVKVKQRGFDLYESFLSGHEAGQTAKARVDPDGIDPPVEPTGGACNSELPSSIEIASPTTDQSVVFQIRTATWNPPIVDGTFHQSVPRGVHHGIIPCNDSN